jgi:4-hydroxy-2-oxoheptanedioate aldolase
MMDMPHNRFKAALREGRTQIGLWVALAHGYAAELLAPAGFDWLLLDAEHAPNDPRSVLPQLQALAAYPVHPIVRPVCNDVALIKQYLDLGVQTLLIPMVDTPAEAAAAVAATRYPPHGIRGVGAAVARASRWNRIADYVHLCNEQMCVLVQVESVHGIGNLAAIAAVEGVDGVFFGPADLAASMGLLGRPLDPLVQSAIENGIATVRAAGKAAGSIMSDRRMAQRYLDLGATFMAVGLDTMLLVDAAAEVAAAFKTGAASGGRDP